MVTKMKSNKTTKKFGKSKKTKGAPIERSPDSIDMFMCSGGKIHRGFEQDGVIYETGPDPNGNGEVVVDTWLHTSRRHGWCRTEIEAIIKHFEDKTVELEDRIRELEHEINRLSDYQ
jgi:hypothetical protein